MEEKQVRCMEEKQCFPDSDFTTAGSRPVDRGGTTTILPDWDSAPWPSDAEAGQAGRPARAGPSQRE